MKKILFLLLFTVSFYGQTLQNPTYGIVTEKNNTTDSTPAYFVTSQTDGVHKKTPAALIAFKSDLPASYTVIVYVNTTNPNSATIFDDVNPPTTNDNAFKTDADNLYIGTDASTWVYNGFIYVTKSIPDGSNFFIRGTTVDAGNSKTENIERIGSIKTSQTLDAGNVNTGGVLANSIVSNGEIVSKKAGSDTVNLGSAFRLSNNSETEINQFQLNASNGVDLWNYASSTWNKRFTFSSGGEFKANKLYLEDVTASTNYATEDFEDIYFNSLRTIITPKNGTAIKSFAQKGSNSDGQIYFMVKSSENGTAGDNMLFGRTAGRVFIANAIDFSNAGAIHLGGNSWNNNDGIIILNGKNSDNSASIKLPTTPTTSAGTYDILTRNISTGVVEKVTSASVAPIASPSLTGTPTAPTATAGTNTDQIATTAFVQNANAGKADLTGSNDISITGFHFLKFNTGGAGLLDAVQGNSFVTEYPTNRWVSNAPILATSFVATAGVIRLKNYTVATLPTGVQGATAYVTDALAPTYMTTVVGGGAIVTPVFYNGTSWVAH